MPVPPQFNPTFNEEDIRRAQEVCRRHSSPQVQVVRAKIALYLHEHPGALTPHVAKALGVHEQTVRKWRKRWTLHGFSLEDLPRRVGRGVFPPEQRVQVIACACEWPSAYDLPLSHFSVRELLGYIESQPNLPKPSLSTLWRWLSEHALRPWRQRSWIYPRP